MIQFSTNLLSDHFHYKSVFHGPGARVHVFGALEEKKHAQLVSSLVNDLAPEWQRPALIKKIKEVTHFVSETGPVWVLARKKSKSNSDHQGRLLESDYTWYREQVGSILGYFKAYDISKVQFFWKLTTKDQELASLVGLNMAAYHFNSHNEKSSEKQGLSSHPQIHHDKSWTSADLQELSARSMAVNLARHLVNCPPNEKNPKTVAQFAQNFFKGKKNLKLEIWDSNRLKKENMGLHLGVGQGAAEAPCMIHLKYRPNKSAKKKSIAFVGKGVTFDTGGLDIKPSSGMRLMKKDMGGSAAVLGLACWASASGYERPLDFYIGLAENSVDSHSMRPSDVLVARNGMKVEIHNTDAEGRLVLADVLDVAVTQKEVPEIVIDIATLTGAIKVALGADIAGLFSNDDKLADELNLAGAQVGDYSWRMPLYQKYTSNMSTPFADIVNAVDGFGGAITAALFLEKFVRGVKWAHLDIYAWNDKSSGPLTFSGGNGQAVQGLIEWLLRRRP